MSYRWPESSTNSRPFDNRSNQFNCVAANTTADLYTGGQNKDLENCLDDIRIWQNAHPDKGQVDRR
jgi:hypothetical protein